MVGRCPIGTMLSGTGSKGIGDPTLRDLGVDMADAILMALLIYREMAWRDRPKVVMDTAMTTGLVMLLVDISSSMGWAMTLADLPHKLLYALEAVSQEPSIVLLFINIALPIIGTFMDLTPALQIVTPILLPVAQEMGLEPLHFGVVTTLNLCIGICTPPASSALFVGTSIAGRHDRRILRTITSFHLAFATVLAIVARVPEASR
jgi:tripartite ATP-independent transporter DctM subunit